MPMIDILHSWPRTRLEDLYGAVTPEQVDSPLPARPAGGALPGTNGGGST